MYATHAVNDGEMKPEGDFKEAVVTKLVVVVAVAVERAETAKAVGWEIVVRTERVMIR